MKWIYLLVLIFMMSGCDLLKSQEQQAKELTQQKEIALKKLSAQTQQELALLESKKDLAEIQKAKELEKIRINAELEKKRIEAELQKEKLLFEQKMAEVQETNSMELQRYMMAILALLVLIGAFFLYFYFKKRHENKLRAYNDNLQKYFLHKENEARVKIAEKMLDAISSGNLDKTQENQLISAFSGESNGEYQKRLESFEEQEVIVTEVETKK